MANPDQPLKVALIAGEPSGDALGAALMNALRREMHGSVEFIGIGGTQMTGQGLHSRIPIAELAVMGLVEVLPKLPVLLRRIDETAAFLRSEKPDVVVTIDSPGFGKRVAKKLTARSFPLVHYVAPTVWAWRPGRARRMAKLYDHLLTLLPFEPPYFEAVGLPATFVGHPAVETIAAVKRTEATADAAGHGFRKRHGIPVDKLLLVVMPGSRRGEVTQLLPVFSAVLEQIKRQGLDLHIVIPTVETVSALVHAEAGKLPFSTTIVEASGERYAAMLAADAALAASGTATLELGLAGVPTILAYKVNALTAAIVRRLLKTPYAGLVNILQGREVMPEFLQENCRSDLIAPALHQLLTEPAARQKQIEACSAVAAQVGANGEDSPSTRAARTILAVAGRYPRTL